MNNLARQAQREVRRKRKDYPWLPADETLRDADLPPACIALFGESTLAMYNGNVDVKCERGEVMHRLQVMIPEEHYTWLREKAQAEGKSIGQLVREAIERFRGTTEVELPSLEKDPIREVVGAFKGPPPHDASVRHDEILYGEGQ